VVSIVGTDEVDLDRNHISWVSPLGRALMKSAAGDSVILQAPRGAEHLTVIIFSAPCSFLHVRFGLRPSLQPFAEDRVGLLHHRRT
jgi:Transcription elongation factor, GreA/GreB, C-term